ncbi:putative NBD/HSP70 family sugar kinase [Haloactinospora alba]|uniref:Putative NBD/HSP70 family sugar kinase n=1 Tax=Haloactinospora alba TaxID=405555 RepID=A0A543NJF4_9ACTN|nr:ROK family transcriptional regulator [Haloactinospora alba]TQN31924.1 putative NBD/HSP70 family sugar kinase [Haloactinospora alba]
MGDAGVTPGSQAALRQANQQRVVEVLRESGTLTQAEIARSTGLSAASVSNIVRNLRSTGAVSVISTSANGRRARAITLVRSPNAVLAIDFSFVTLTVALGDGQGAVLARESISYDVAADPERSVRRAVWLAETLLARSRVDHASVSLVCASVPGPVAPDSGEVSPITCMPRWAGFRPAASLSHRLGLPVVVENDANVCALAEVSVGAARGSRHVVYVRLGEGVGAGIVIDGHVFRGVGGTAGEIGHMALDSRGQVCRCGNRGCLETLVGAPYLLSMVPSQAGTESPAELGALIAAARSGDPGCQRVVSDAGTALGHGMGVVATMVNPQVVVVGGELAEAGDLLLEPMRRAMELGTLGSALGDLRVVAGELASDAPLRGALHIAAVSAG